MLLMLIPVALVVLVAAKVAAKATRVLAELAQWLATATLRLSAMIGHRALVAPDAEPAAPLIDLARIEDLEQARDTLREALAVIDEAETRHAEDWPTLRDDPAGVRTA